MLNLHPKQFALLALWLALCVTTYGQAGTKEEPDPRTNTERVYDRVLDLLFPLNTLKVSDREFVIIVRYKPSFEAESQIIIVKGEKGAEVTEYQSSEGNIFARLDEMMARTGSDDAGFLAGQIRVRRRRISIPASTIKRWHGSFASSLYQSLLVTPGAGTKDKGFVILDGTEYELWYVSESKRVTSRFVGSNGPPSHESQPLVKWMKEVRRWVKSLGAQNSRSSSWSESPRA